MELEKFEMSLEPSVDGIQVPREGTLCIYTKFSSLKHHIGIPQEKWSFAVSARSGSATSM